MINKLNIPYPDFRIGHVIDPEKFDENNKQIQNKINEIIDEGNAPHTYPTRFTIGTSTAGWTDADCDYLCDGTTDDVEINAAITALPATGGEIVILDGTYNITARINVTKNNVSIRGNGNATILKRMFDSSIKEGVITLSSRSGCKIANLQINGNETSYTHYNNCGICLRSSNDNTITSNTCNNNTSYGIYLSSACNNIITGNACNNNNDSIYLDVSNDNIITGNTCNNNNNCGIYLNGSGSNTITGNTCNINSYGIYLTSASSSNNVVTGNTCNNNNSGGIYLEYLSSDSAITGNICNDNDYGIRLSYSSNNTITGNICNNNNHGIHSKSSNNNAITGNTCRNNSQAGIRLDSDSNNTITGNTCNNNGRAGIYLYNSSNNNAITGNTCIRGTGLETDYISSQSTIHLIGLGNSYNLISNNNCMGKAVGIDGGTGNTLVNNKFDEA